MFANHYASLISIRAVHDAEAKLRSIMSEARQNTKAVNAKEKELNAWKRAATNQINSSKMDAASRFFKEFENSSVYGKYFVDGQIDYEKLVADNNAQEYGRLQSQAQAMAQQTIQLQLAQLEEEYEQLVAEELDPLKQLAEDLEVDKANAEQELEIAKQTRDATKKMAQEDTKNLWA